MVTDQTPMPELTGTLHGQNRTELLTVAGARAAEYFGTTCVAVKLENETPHPMLSGFNASFRARVHHDIEKTTYGPNFCRGCKRDSWPQDPLPTAKWSK